MPPGYPFRGHQPQTPERAVATHGCDHAPTARAAFLTPPPSLKSANPDRKLDAMNRREARTPPEPLFFPARSARTRTMLTVKCVAGAVGGDGGGFARRDDPRPSILGGPFV